MAAKTFSFLIFTVALSRVATWTIDLPEVRKYFFEKHENMKLNQSYADNGERVFDNIKSDSPLNAPSNENHLYDFLKNPSNDDENDVYNGGKYASDFAYQTYRQKEVHKIVRDGSLYLDGLRGAIEQFAERLKVCQEQQKKSQPTSSTSNSRWLPENERPLPGAPSTSTEECDRVTRSSEHVRRLSELALWATNELQDRAYNHKYDGPSSDQEENELLLRLAWFLDRLAQLTGFQLQKEYSVEMSTTTSTTTPQPVTLAPSSQEIVQYLLQCMKQDDSRPAPDRCRYPLTLPDSVKKIFNTTDVPSSTTEINSQAPKDIVYLTAQTTNNEKRSTSEHKHSIERRSISDENPSLYFMKYFIKHKVWESDNPNTQQAGNDKTYEIQNHLADASALKTLEKRSIDKKKSMHFRLPENPMQDISYYSKHKSGIRLVKDEGQAKKFCLFLDKIRNSNRLVAKKNALRLEKSLYTPKRYDGLQRPKRSVPNSFLPRFLEKRSAHYPKKNRPRIPENPFQDISYYVKRKRGINYNPSVEQAGLFRLGLEQIFQTGNIEVVRRYGSNYNPAVPAPYYAAIAASMADQ